MKRNVITLFLVAALFFVPVFVLVGNHPQIIEMERRPIAAFPQKPKSLAANRIKKFFKEIESYYSDRIPFRSAFIVIAEYINKFGKIDINLDKCYTGKDNWLFLGNDYDHCIDTLVGTWKPSEEEEKSQLRFFMNVNDVINEFGAEFYMIIGPNKSSVYEEYLPPHIIPSEFKVSDKLVDNLKKHNIRIFNAIDCIKDNKKLGLLYYKTDTHWNALGAYVALDGFFKEMFHAALPECTFTTADKFYGDLVSIGGYRSFPVEEGDNVIAAWKDKDHVPVMDKTLLVLGDSFSLALMPYPESVFKDVHRVHYDQIIKNNDVGALKTYLSSLEAKPDMVLWVQVERIFAHWAM